MLDINRHLEVIKPWEHPAPITIIGVGATGSRVAMALVELGFTNIRFVDFDHVEPHNLPNQAYLHPHIGMQKVEALADLIKLKIGDDRDFEHFKFYNAKVPNEDVPIEGYVFLLTDTISSRLEILEKCLQGNDKVIQVIETRMASTHGHVFIFNPNHLMQRRAWVKSLPKEDETEVSTCGSSISVGVTASLIANLAVWQFILLLQNEGLHEARVNLFCKPAALGCMTLE